MQIPDQYKKSGVITRAVRELVPDLVKPGGRLADVSAVVEEEVRRRGGFPAFPTGIGVNHVTAHYAPQEGDETRFKEGDLVKVDFGVHVDGYVTDTSTTISLGREDDLIIDAAKKCLEVAIDAVKSDPRVGEVGRRVYAEARRFGFRTIENLTGHTVDRFVVHAGKSIPNLYVPGMPVLKEGDVFAIEPFLTSSEAAGYVVNSRTTTIFAIASRKKTATGDLDKFVDDVWNDRKTLPFSPRWYVEEWGRKKLDVVITELVKRKIVHGYPTLVEASGSRVAQFEHTAAIEGGSLVVLT